jgi:hypothetical protein
MAAFNQLKLLLKKAYLAWPL